MERWPSTWVAIQTGSTELGDLNTVRPIIANDKMGIIINKAAKFKHLSISCPAYPGDT